MMRWAKQQALGPIDPKGHRIIGLSHDKREPIFAPKGHSLCLAANGAGKTTNVAMPALLDLASSEPEKAILVFDGKHAELAAQAAPMLHQMGRPVRIIDDMRVRPELDYLRIELNAFGAAAETYRRNPRDIIFASETLAHAMIEEPSNDARNKYWRAWPRLLLEFANGVMLKRNVEYATPGATAAILADPDLLISFADIESEEGDLLLQTQARAIQSMRGHEHFGQHLEEASRAARIFLPGTRLAEAGANAEHTHENLVREGAIVFLCGPQERMSRLSTYFALHIQGFCEALYAGSGELRAICDEFTNMPLQTLVEALTTLRAFGGEFHMIAQSRSEVLRKYGQHQTATLEENAIVKTYLGFSSFEEAERISKAMGEEHAVATALGGDGEGQRLNTNLSLIKQRNMTAAELMAIPRGQMLVHVKGVGFFLGECLGQQHRAPYCHLLGDNPLEGGRLAPDPQITLTTPKVSS